MKLENWVKRALKSYKGKKKGVFLVVPLRYWGEIADRQIKDFKMPKITGKIINTGIIKKEI